MKIPTLSPYTLVIITLTLVIGVLAFLLLRNEQPLIYEPDNPNHIIETQPEITERRERPANTAEGCIRAGCSGQLCVNANQDDVVSTCEYLNEYACYQQATCEIQPNGNCGFTPTEELATCLDKATSNPFELAQ